MITDEGASFLSDLKRYETKHESYISLLNQLFDGKGDKMTLANNVERPVPRNATSLSIGVQQKSFCDAIFGLSETLWLDNGFGERFIFSEPDRTGTYMHKHISISNSNIPTFVLNRKYKCIFHSDTNGRQIRKLPKN